jgi:TonB-linked SusC/RagA family outer membrane protein
MRKKILLSGILMLFCILQTMAQQRIVTGKITDATSGQAVQGATVSVSGTNVATTTNSEGSFSISVPKPNSRLVISDVGYEAQIIPANKNFLELALKTSVSTLNEVVVTGYTSQRKKDITGSVSVVNVNELKQSPVGTGEEALQGRASGVTIITSGQPGARSDIRIRGITGFGNNSPLIIVDGVRGDLHDINVADIESMQVLKDASAAIYGVAGANGVIIITTKKGKSGKAKISYDGYYGVTTRGPGYDMANPTQEANAIWQQQRNSGVVGNPSSKQYGNGATPVIPDYITPTGYTLCNCAADSVVDLKRYNRDNYQITKANKTGTNWYDAITRNAPSQSHNLSVASGTDKSSYYFSMNYLNEQGIARYSSQKRYSVRANTQFNIKDHIRVGENAYVFFKNNPTYSNQGEGSPFSVAFREDAIIPVYDIAGNFGGTKSQDLGNARNVFADEFRTKDNKGNSWDIQGNVYAEVDFLKHFTARSSFGGTINNNYYYYFNYVGYENAEGNTGANSFHEGASFNSQWTFNNTVTYSNTFGKHSVKALVGTEAVNYSGRNLEAGRSNYFSENPNYWILSAGNPTGASNTGNAYQNSIWSQFARLEYGYAGKYLINGSVRRDGASVFAPDQRQGYFPAVSAAWRISQEEFFKPIVFVNDLKIRYSWGKLGSINNVGSTNPFNLYGSSPGRSYYSIDGSNTVPTSGFYSSYIGNPATSWERDIISNIGIDATILNNKIDFSIDYYKKKISGLLFQASGSQFDRIFVGDARLPQVNIGNMQNTGIDANATYHGSAGKDFKFDISGTFTSYNNKIVSLPGLPYFNGDGIRNITPTRNQVGHSVGSFFGYKVIGLFQSADDVAKSPTQSGAEPGLFKYQDVNGDGKIDANDRTFIGNPNPKFSYGLNISMSYKSFDFSTFFFGSEGNDIFNNTLTFTDFPDFFKGGIRREVALNAWTPTHTNTSIPKLVNKGSFSSDQVANSYFLSKGSYLRNKQMQLGYTLPSSVLSRIGVDHFRIYIQATNLFTITKYTGLDPELQNSDINRGVGFGIDNGNYPHTAAYLVGVNLNF